MWAVQIWNRNKQEYGRCVRSWNTGLRLRCTYLINLYLLKYISQFDHKRGHMCDFTPVSKWHVQHMNCHLCDRVDNHGSFYTVPSTFPQMLHAPSIGSLDRTSLELPSPLLRVQMVRIWVTSDKAKALGVGQPNFPNIKPFEVSPGQRPLDIRGVVCCGTCHHRR